MNIKLRFDIRVINTFEYQAFQIKLRSIGNNLRNSKRKNNPNQWKTPMVSVTHRAKMKRKTERMKKKKKKKRNLIIIPQVRTDVFFFL